MYVRREARFWNNLGFWGFDENLWTSLSFNLSFFANSRWATGFFS